MIVLLTFLAAVVSWTPTSPETSCNQDCEAVLEATLRWTVAQVPIGDRTRMFLDTAWANVRKNVPQDSAIVRTPMPILAQIAGKLGAPSRGREEVEGWRACNQDPTSVACDAARGTTIIKIHRLRFLSKNEATILADIDVVRGAHGRLQWTSGKTWELHLRQVGTGWQVVAERLLVIAN